AVVKLAGNPSPLLLLCRDQPIVQRADLPLLLLALSQVQYECHALVDRPLEDRATDKHGDAGAVFAEELPFMGLNCSRLFQLGQRAHLAVAPLRGSQIGPPDTAR